MNAKFSSQILGLFRSYHQHGQYHNRHQQLNRFSLYTWKFLLNKLKEELPRRRNLPEYFKKVQNGLKMVVSFLGKETSPIIGQRAFRSYRILHIHSKLWSYTTNSNPVTKRALLSFVMLSLCQAKNLEQTIKDVELTKHAKDLDYIRELTAATVVCKKCKDRLPIDKKINGVKYCLCNNTTPSVFGLRIPGHVWTPFAETADLLIWRKPHPEIPDLYVYKVYGYYDDISAQDFLEAQLDIEYRKQWDDTALQLDVIEKEPKSRSEIIYWEMKWPKMFTNRDYLFLRRHKVYRDRRDMVIMSKAVTHPNVPERKGVHRVTQYWSVMHIRAAKGLSQTGVEFGLTYFDNPGVSLPQWLTNWAAMTGIPEFLNKQRRAARARRESRTPQTSIAVSSPQSHYSDKKRPATLPSSPCVATPSPTPVVPSSSSSNLPKDNKESKQEDLVTIISNNSKNNLNSTTTTATNNVTNNSNSPKNKVASNKNVNSLTNSSSPTATQLSSSPSSSSQQQQEGKNELLSQFFKEQVLDVHS